MTHSRCSDGSLARWGTAFYLAPELINEGRPTHETDTYSMGIVLLEVMYGCQISRLPRYKQLRRSIGKTAFRDQVSRDIAIGDYVIIYDDDSIFKHWQRELVTDLLAMIQLKDTRAPMTAVLDKWKKKDKLYFQYTP